MQNCGVWQLGLKQQGAPLVGRFVTKLVVEVLPAALASLIGGYLFSQYQATRPAVEHPVAVQVGPASTEMMQLLRDEHSAILDYLKTERSSEKTQIAAAAEEDARAVADAKAAAEIKAQVIARAQIEAEAKAAADAKLLAAAAARRLALAAKAAAPHPKPAAAIAQISPATTHEPLVIAQADPAAAQDRATARDPDLLIGRTLDLKDHVVAATRNVVSAIGDIPTWIAGRLSNSAPQPAPRQFSAAS